MFLRSIDKQQQQQPQTINLLHKASDRDHRKTTGKPWAELKMIHAVIYQNSYFSLDDLVDPHVSTQEHNFFHLLSL